MLLPLLTRVLDRQLAVDAHLADWEKHARNVALYRRYVDGDHDIRLSRQQRAALQIRRPGDEFCDNYMEIVVRTMLNRLRVSRIEADTADGTAWAAQRLTFNRFDGMQLAVHEAVLTDGDTYVMVGFDNQRGIATLHHELAYDGISGLIPIYRSDTSTVMDAAVKIWWETIYDEKLLNVLRVNLYYPDRIERYIRRSTMLEPYHGTLARPIAAVSPWTARDGTPLGVPVVHFRNRPRGLYGISEIEKAIPLQDALNSVLHDVVMASRLTGFQLRTAIGFDPPADLAPGDWVIVGKEGLDNTQQVDVKTLPVGDVSQLLSVARWLTREIGNVTSTAAPELFSSDDLSGEAFRRREINLIGKCEALQVGVGNSWEDCLRMAAAVETAYGHHLPPTSSRFYTMWVDPRLNDSATLIDNALKVADRLPRRELLRLLAPAFGWDETKITQILAESA